MTDDMINRMVGREFGRLTVLAFSHIKQSNSYWKCECTCGDLCVLPAHRMKSGGVTSCGCGKMSKHEQGSTGLNILYSTYKDNAKNNSRLFDLTLKEFKEITSRNCFYCGIEPETKAVSTWASNNANLREHSKYLYNGIDRVDSSRGYERDNIVPCCKWCNLAKADKTAEEFKEHIFKMHTFMSRGDFL